MSIKSNNANGVIPNASLEKSNVGFNGSLNLTSRLTSSLSLNYANTKGFGRPASGYSPSQGNPLQSFNQWFQRQLDMDKLRQYRGEDGSIYSWNMRSVSDQRPLYWDSPFSLFMKMSPKMSVIGFLVIFLLDINKVQIWFLKALLERICTTL